MDNVCRTFKYVEVCVQLSLSKISKERTGEVYTYMIQINILELLTHIIL